MRRIVEMYRRNPIFWAVMTYLIFSAVVLTAGTISDLI